MNNWCPNCQKFITPELTPIYERLKDLEKRVNRLENPKGRFIENMSSCAKNKENAAVCPICSGELITKENV